MCLSISRMTLVNSAVVLYDLEGLGVGLAAVFNDLDMEIWRT